LHGADLRGANLGGANLGDANLGDADLGGANLHGADLRGAKNYNNSHNFAIEIIRRQDIKSFTEKEWAVIGIISTHRICWEEIIKEYKKPCLSIFKKLKKYGFGEYLDELSSQR